MLSKKFFIFITITSLFTLNDAISVPGRNKKTVASHPHKKSKRHPRNIVELPIQPPHLMTIDSTGPAISDGPAQVTPLPQPQQSNDRLIVKKVAYSQTEPLAYLHPIAEASPNSSSLFQFLPAEVISQVIEYLNFHDKLSIYQTSKRLQKFRNYIKRIIATNDFNCRNLAFVAHHSAVLQVLIVSELSPNSLEPTLKTLLDLIKQNKLTQIQKLVLRGKYCQKNHKYNPSIDDNPLYYALVNQIHSKNFPELQSLEISNINFNPDQWNSLANNFLNHEGFFKLNSLTISNCLPCYPEEFHFLTSLFTMIDKNNFPALQHLNLKGMIVKFNDLNMLTELVKIRRLTKLLELDISENHLLPEGYKSILGEAFTSGHLQNIKVLNLSRFLKGDINLTLLQMAKVKMNHLISLDLSENWVLDQRGLKSCNFMTELSEAIQSQAFPCLEILNLKEVYAGPSEISLLFKAITHSGPTTLVSLNLSQNNLGDEGFEALAETIFSHKLDRVSILILRAPDRSQTLNSITSQGLVKFLHVIQKAKLPRLNHLDLHNIRLGKEGWLELTRAIAMRGLPVLEVLIVSNTGAGEEGIQILADLIASGTLMELNQLNISGNQAGPHAAKAFVELFLTHPMNALVSLNIDNNLVGIESINLLINGILRGHFPHLKDLSFANNRLGDDFIKDFVHFLSLGHFPKLRYLNYSGNSQPKTKNIFLNPSFLRPPLKPING